MLQVELKFTLKFCNLGWFSLFGLLALIIQELGLGDKGNWESTQLKKIKLYFPLAEE